MTKKTENARTRYVWVNEHQRVLIPGDPTRLGEAVSWAGWHMPELAGVLVPAGFAVLTPWALLVAGLVAAGWAVFEVRLGREQAAIKAGRDLPVAEVAPTDVAVRESGVDQSASDDAVDDEARVGGGVSL